MVLNWLLQELEESREQSRRLQAELDLLVQQTTQVAQGPVPTVVRGLRDGKPPQPNASDTQLISSEIDRSAVSAASVATERRAGFGPGPLKASLEWRSPRMDHRNFEFEDGDFRAHSTRQEVSASDVQDVNAPLPCIIISDPGEDLDDEMAMVMLRYLVGKKYIECKGVIVNLKPASTRARLMRGTLDTLGLWGVPVAVGTDGGVVLHRETFCDTAKSYMPDEYSQRSQCFCSGRGLLHRILIDAEAKSIRLVCISSLKDAALFMRDNTALFVEKIHSVTIMGGVHDFDNSDTSGFLQPDTAQNNVYDEAASDFVYRRCQELRVPMVVLCRHAAYACPVSKKIYDTMKRTNSPIGKRLHLAQKSSIENLWKRASATEGGPERMGLPARCDRDWFQRTFCGGAVIEGAECWPYVTTFNMYDPMAIIAAVPALRERFFIARTKVIQGVQHQVIGISKEENGVREAPPLHHFMLNAFFQGITADLVPCEECIIITDPGQDQDDEMALIMLRNLSELRLMKCIGVICNLLPSNARARLARGTLDVLGLSDVPVGIGSDGGSTTHKDSFSGTALGYIPAVVSGDDKQMKTSSSIHPDGQALLRHLYESAPAAGNIVLICISSLKDAAQFLRENEALFVAKTKSVTIQGGCLPFESSSPVFLEPDTAQNNVFDREAGFFFYRRCQELGVKLTIMSRHAAYRCPMPRSIYDKIASTNSPIGVRLRSCQQQAIDDLWRRACLPVSLCVCV